MYFSVAFSFYGIFLCFFRHNLNITFQPLKLISEVFLVFTENKRRYHFLDEHFMKIALQLAQSVKGQTSPNPPVGAVIVKDGAIRGLGAHLQAGQDHAEIEAIKMAGLDCKDATIYVTLEPCSHFGKTGPCADTIIAHEFQRVVIASLDPNKKVAGQGIEKLQKAGLDVTVGILEEQANELYDVFFHYIKTKTPFITLKSAVTLDGKTATKTGESKWITGEAARKDVHHYRHTHDAILVGVNTVLLDDPLLTSRLTEGKHPTRIILDTNLRTPLEANVLQNSDAATIIFVGKNVAKEKIANYEKIDHLSIMQVDTEELVIPHIVGILGKLKFTSLFVEGGATVNDAFLQAGLINQYIIYLAPKLIGGKDAPTAITGTGFAEMADIFELEITQVEKIGKDVKIIAKKKGAT